MDVPIHMVTIARDEAAQIEAFVRHHSAVCDSILVADTGSRDDTAALARRAGARVLRVAWNDDFSAARNAALEAAPKRGYALCLDVDERIAQRDFAALRAAAASGACCLLPQRNYWNDPSHPFFEPVRGDYPEYESGAAGYFVALNSKLFPLDPPVRFSGRVHETAVESARRLGLAVRTIDVPIHHFGYVVSDAHNRSRNERYVALLARKVRDRPDDVQALEEYGTALVQVHRIDEAVAALRRAAEGPPGLQAVVRAQLVLALVYAARDEFESAEQVLCAAREAAPDNRFVHRALVQLYARFGRRMRHKRAVTAAVTRFPDDPVLLLEYARFCADTHRWDEARAALNKAAAALPGHEGIAALAARLNG